VLNLFEAAEKSPNGLATGVLVTTPYSIVEVLAYHISIMHTHLLPVTVYILSPIKYLISLQVTIRCAFPVPFRYI
jgi:hypothetical protein